LQLFLENTAKIVEQERRRQAGWLDEWRWPDRKQHLAKTT
jgi:hypothetical protein